MAAGVARASLQWLSRVAGRAVEMLCAEIQTPVHDHHDGWLVTMTALHVSSMLGVRLTCVGMCWSVGWLTGDVMRTKEGPDQVWIRAVDLCVMWQCECLGGPLSSLLCCLTTGRSYVCCYWGADDWPGVDIQLFNNGHLYIYIYISLQRNATPLRLPIYKNKSMGTS